VVGDPWRLVRRVVDTPELVAPDVVRAVLAEIEWAQARLVGPDAYATAARAAGRHPSMPVNEIAHTYGRYVAAKKTHGVIDLNDLLVAAADLLEGDTAAAAASRWRIRHLFVDEFQDMNPAQWRLLQAWLGGRSDLFVVGDPRQAVYGWNGADPTLLDRLPELLPGTTVLRLDANHRSTPQIIAAGRAVLDSGDRSPGTGPRHRPTGSDLGPAAATGGGRPDGPGPSVTGFDNDGDEAAAVARWLRAMHRPGRPWSHLAVLARTNARLGPVAAVLRSAGIPVRLGAMARTGGELRDGIDLLKAMAPSRDLRSALADLSLADGGERGGPPGTPWGVPRALARLADEHAVEVPGPTVGGFLAWLAATVDDAAASETEAGDAVELSTFHRAKGLEWPAVALIGLEDGLVPISYATSPAAQAEEQRLFYVAVTRAEEHLWCSWAHERESAGRSWTCRPSPFLAAIEASAQSTAVTDRPAFAAQMASLRERLPAAG
jgi:DNA helicase-2/ATP-dependent DNA helicase PcrA